MPIRTPATSPLNMDPITMPTIPARTAGVNQAVRPSRIPKMPPRTKPSTILLLMVAHSLERWCLSIVVLTAFARTFKPFLLNLAQLNLAQLNQAQLNLAQLNQAQLNQSR